MIEFFPPHPTKITLAASLVCLFFLKEYSIGAMQGLLDKYMSVFNNMFIDFLRGFTNYFYSNNIVYSIIKCVIK